MNNKDTISLEDAKQQFATLMQCLDKTVQEQFFSFIIQEWKPANVECNIGSDTQELFNNVDNEVLEDPVFLLNLIANDIKAKVPFNAILPSENITSPTIGENSDCDPSTTLHVDEFLYSDDDITELEDTGNLSRYYCRDCYSRNIELLTFISHSTSRDALYFIFNNLLPILKEKTILDIGSRLGAVLYGAYVYTDAKRIIGVEMNEELCALQRDIVHRYKMKDRVEIHHKRIEDVPDLLKASDVVVINNSFEFYMPLEEQINVWKFLRDNISRGTILVMRPRIETALEHLQTDISADQWLRPMPRSCANNKDFLLHAVFGDDDEKYSDIACYEVL